MSKAHHPASAAAGWRLEHRYAALPEAFHRPWAPSPVREPRLVLFNRGLAGELGLDPEAFDHPDAGPLFAGNVLPEGAHPIAQAYAGHQFGHFTALGDGRALLLGEQRTPAGHPVDVQLKGPGPTPFSRRGDGRAALGPMVREYLVSEAMHALGIPTTRSLAVAATGEIVHREEALPGAVLTRTASSHIRVGTFEWAAAQDDPALLQALFDHTLERHDPDLMELPPPDRPAAFLSAVLERQAALVARWLTVGFVHGVMNTDNMALSGETIDYGPCAFLDGYDPGTVFSSIDHQGRYAYGRQPGIAHWNLARFAETLIPLLHPVEAQGLEIANDRIRAFPARFQHHWRQGMRAKLGLFREQPGDEVLVDDLLAGLHRARADWTHTFRQLSVETPEIGVLPEGSGLEEWFHRWTTRRTQQAEAPSESTALMRRHNPAVIPRNQAVETALEAAWREANFAPLRRLLTALASPYESSTGETHPDLAQPPPSSLGPYRTFCGT